MVAGARGADDGGAQVARDLYGERADPARGGMDEHGFTPADLEFLQGCVSGLAGGREHPGHFPGHALGLGDHLFDRGHRVFGVAREQLPAEHAVTGGELGDALPDGVDGPGELVAEDLREGDRETERKALAERCVEGLDAGGADPYPDLPRARLGRGELDGFEYVGSPVCGERDCAHLLFLTSVPVVSDVADSGGQSPG